MIPHQHQQTRNGDNFLSLDNGVGYAERVIIYSSVQKMQLLTNSAHWFTDRTFQLYPEVFSQIYKTHVEQGGKIFPCVFALLPNKSQAILQRFFR